MPNSKNSRVPVVTIGGFLGAGKTTLLNHVLAQSNGRRIVVFVNDFGAINIDYALVETADNNRISLKNGCVCCSLNDDLIGNIKDFVKQGARPYAFVIEASGVADPRSLVQSINSLEAAGDVRLDNQIYVVDADQFIDGDFEYSEQVIDHAAASDLIVLNKVDLVSNLQLSEVRQVFKQSAPNSSLVEAIQCDLPIDVVVGDRPLSSTKSAANTDTTKTHTAPIAHNFTSWSRQTNQRLARDKFDVFAARLTEVCFRAKGQLIFVGKENEAATFHLVGKRASLEALKIKTQDDASGTSAIVAIGKSGTLDKNQLDAWFDEIVA